MCENVQICCRICLDVESDHVSILEDPTICLHLKSCLAVAVSPNDHLPKSICVSCVSLLNQFYNFQLNARCSQDWLESSVEEKSKKPSENKMIVQPLPDSEYNSDSLLEFLNNTANIEEYLNNLGKEDIPCIVNMLDKNEHNIENNKASNKTTKTISPKKKDSNPKKFKFGGDIVNTEFQLVKGIFSKDTDTKVQLHQQKLDSKRTFVCFACNVKFDTVQRLLQHMSTCDLASRKCIHCNLLFDSKLQMQKHSLTHNIATLKCNCGQQFSTKERLIHHHRTCHMDLAASIGCTYRCKECGDSFKERVELYKHAKEHVVKAQERVCDICGHTFCGNDALIKHRKDEHESPANVMYRCKICKYTLPSHSEMYLHVKKHTTRPSKPVPSRHLCETCGQSFATHASLIRHAHTHNTSTNVCSTCNKRFANVKSLEIHRIEHTDLAMCEKCGQSVSMFKLSLHNCG